MIATLAFALSVGPTVDFDHAPAPTPVIVEALAKQLGRNLVADEKLAVDILIVHLDHADADEALGWIAEAIDGEWVEKDGVQRLTRSHATEVAQEQAERSQRLRTIQRNLDLIEVAPPLDKPTAELVAELLKPFEVSLDIPSDLRARLPLNRLALRINKAIDFGPFLEMPYGTSIYVPFNESQIDRRLPASLKKLLADYKAEDAIYSAALRSRGIAFPEYLWYGAYEPGKWRDGSLQGAVRVMSEGLGLDMQLALAWGSGPTLEIAPLLNYSSTLPPRTLAHAEWNVPPDMGPEARKYWSLRAPRMFIKPEQTVRVPSELRAVGSSRVDLQACKLEYSIVSPK